MQTKEAASQVPTFALIPNPESPSQGLAYLGDAPVSHQPTNKIFFLAWEGDTQ